MEQKKSFGAFSNLVFCGVIAGVYIALTLLFAPISYGAVQFRVSEALTVLPFIYPPSCIGLFVGCAIANIFTPNIPILDIICGSAATLAAGLLTVKMPNKFFAPLPPIILNGLVIGAVIAYSAGGTQNFFLLFALNAALVALGEAVVCFGLGVPLLAAFERIPMFRKSNAGRN